MAHNPTIRTPVTLWTPGSVVGVNEIANLDIQLAGSVNGADGSAHAPTFQGVIGGQGLDVTGPSQVAYGGQLVSTATTGGISLEDGDYPLLAPGHAGATQVRTYLAISGVPLTDALMQSYYLQQTGVTGGSPPQPIYNTLVPWPAPQVFRYRWSDMGAQALATNVDFSDGSGPQPMQLRIPIRAYDGSTLTQVVVWWHVPTTYAQPPTRMPLVRVIRIDAFGNVNALTSVAVGADVFGHVSPPAATSGSSWHNNGAPQSLVIPCDQNNAISIASYTYAVEVIEEGGLSGFPYELRVMQPAQVVANSNHPLTGPDGGGGTTTVDGVTVGDWNERVLVAGGLLPATWSANSGYSTGALVNVIASGTTFRCVQAGASGATFPTGTFGAGSTVQDGSVVWLSKGATSDPANTTPDMIGNGIWIAKKGTWQRASDLTNASDFTQGFVVPIALGQSMAGSVVQCSASIASWQPGVDALLFVASIADDDPSTTTDGQAMFARATVWHSAVCTFTGITENGFD